jgi:hypothetical protein
MSDHDRIKVWASQWPDLLADGPAFWQSLDPDDCRRLLQLRQNVLAAAAIEL